MIMIIITHVVVSNIHVMIIIIIYLYKIEQYVNNNNSNKCSSLSHCIISFKNKQILTKFLSEAWDILKVHGKIVKAVSVIDLNYDETLLIAENFQSKSTPCIYFILMPQF